MKTSKKCQLCGATSEVAPRVRRCKRIVKRWGRNYYCWGNLESPEKPKMTPKPKTDAPTGDSTIKTLRCTSCGHVVEWDTSTPRPRSCENRIAMLGGAAGTGKYCGGSFAAIGSKRASATDSERAQAAQAQADAYAAQARRYLNLQAKWSKKAKYYNGRVAGELKRVQHEKKSKPSRHDRKIDLEA